MEVRPGGGGPRRTLYIYPHSGHPAHPMTRSKQIAQGRFGKDKFGKAKVVTSAHAGGVKPPGGVKPRPHRYRPGTIALLEIKKYQRSTSTLARKRPFSRLVRESGQLIISTARFERHGVDALQRITEAYITRLFEDALLCAFHAKRVTLKAKDLMLAIRIRENTSGPFFYKRSKMSSDDQKKRDAALANEAHRSAKIATNGKLRDSVTYV